MAKISRRRLAQATIDLLVEQPNDRQRILQSVAAYLILHKQTKQLHLLIKDLAKELELSEGHLFAEIESPFTLDASSRQQLETYLKAKTGAKTVELSEQTNPSLLSGVVVRTANLELDTSAKTKLAHLASLNSRGEI